MPRRLLSNLSTMVREKRGSKTLREVAGEMSIGPATLMRVENGRIPDLTTFGKICKWLQVDPGTFLGFERKGALSKGAEQKTSSALLVSGHFRADQTLQPETAQALAKMILLAVRQQPSSALVPEDDDN